MSRFLSGGPVTSTENHARVVEQIVDRAMSAGVNGIPLMAQIRGGTNPIPQINGYYNEDDELVQYQRVNEVIGSGPLAP